MVNNMGQWTPEADYTNYPQEKMCFMDRLANYIQSENYAPKTNVENLCYMILGHFDGYREDADEAVDSMDVEQTIEFIKMSGGLKEFDYYC